MPAAAPALVPAGGLSADGMDEEGRERVAVLKRQLTQQLQSGYAITLNVWWCRQRPQQAFRV